MGPRASSVIGEEERMVDSRRISLIKLIEGGAAIFVATRRNHHIDIMGNRFNIPLVKNNLRDEVDS